MSDTPKEETEKPQDDDAKDASAESDGNQSDDGQITEEKEGKKSTMSGGRRVADLHGKFHIDCDKRLTKFDVGEIKAYEASSSGKDSGSFLALVCEPHLTPRRRAANVYENIVNPSSFSLIRHGIAHWPPEDAQRYIVVYRLNFRTTIASLEGKQAFGLKDDEVIDNILHPMINVLQDFRDKDFVHGAIRPNNIFHSGSGRVEKPVLGDCLSVPCSYHQPVLYLPIEKAMIDPIGRGVTTQADDLYALGVTLAVMLRHQDPMQSLTDKEIIEQKIEHGSYVALVGGDRLKGNVIELLRGLLIDDSAQRWTVDDVLAWIDGRRLSQKQVVREKKAQRPLKFGTKKYFLASRLAMDIPSNPQEVVRIVEQEELQLWVGRSLQDDAVEARLTDAINYSQDKGTGPGYEDRLVCNVSMALDTRAPLRYKGLNLYGTGIGAALAEAILIKKDLNPFVEIFSYGLAMNWLIMSSDPYLDTGAHLPKFDSCRSFTRQTNAGYGIERCLYYLSPDTPCLSSKVSKYFVRGSEDLIEAFEDICAQNKMSGLFLDRHSIGFLCARDPKSVEGYLPELNGPEPYKIILGNLKTLATIQKRGKLHEFPAIAQYIADKLDPVYDRYHDREVREKLKKNISRYASDGDLVQMAGLLDNVELPAKDFTNFKQAMAQYHELNKEYDKLEEALKNERSFGIATGNEFAAVFGSLLAGLIILGMAFMTFSGQSFF